MSASGILLLHKPTNSYPCNPLRALLTMYYCHSGSMNLWNFCPCTKKDQPLLNKGLFAIYFLMFMVQTAGMSTWSIPETITLIHQFWHTMGLWDTDK